MKAKWSIVIASILLCSCTRFSPPGYMRAAESVRIFLPDNSQSSVLTPAEASALLRDFDGRLFTNGKRISEAYQQTKNHVLTVAYPYADDSETHIHVYSDGTVGYIRTMLTYETYPMEAYCAHAIRLAEQRGLTIERK